MRTCLLISILFLASPALAQDRAKCGDDQGEAKYEVVKGADGRKIFRIKTVFCIEGKVPKPSVIYVLNAKPINYRWSGLKKNFVAKIIEATKKKPF